MFQARYFVADNVLDEVTFGWPRQKGDIQMKEHLALKLQQAINWVLFCPFSMNTVSSTLWVFHVKFL